MPEFLPDGNEERDGEEEEEELVVFVLEDKLEAELDDFLPPEVDDSVLEEEEELRLSPGECLRGRPRFFLPESVSFKQLVEATPVEDVTELERCLLGSFSLRSSPSVSRDVSRIRLRVLLLPLLLPVEQLLLVLW